MLSNQDNILRPPVEIVETETDLMIQLEMPGVNVNDLDVRTTENAVFIAGKRSKKHLPKGQKLIYSQLNYGRVECTIDLPALISSDRVEAELIDGILTLTLPKVKQRAIASDRDYLMERLALFSA
jgi:HSP20 family protein